MPRVLSNISNNAVINNISKNETKSRINGKRVALSKVDSPMNNKRAKNCENDYKHSDLNVKEKIKKLVETNNNNNLKEDAKMVVDLTRSIEMKVKKITITSDEEKKITKKPVVSEEKEKVIKSVSLVKKVTKESEKKEYDFCNPHTYYQAPPKLPPYVDDFDEEQLDEISSEPHYAYDIFDYLKKKESTCKITKYMNNQPEINKAMRAVLVDWLVEVQESFELNHETLYLAVKLVDFYLMKVKITKSRFQLLGVTAMFIAAKFDERLPPGIADFLYICDDAYTDRDIILFEIDMLKKTEFFLGFPLSYRFLRRYARCCKLSLEVLTLARYILEMSLMEYELIEESDSLMASASLLLALKMSSKNVDAKWPAAAEYYSGYKECELINLMYMLNDIISTPKPNLKTITAKYSHKIFFEVAKISPLQPMKEKEITTKK